MVYIILYNIGIKRICAIIQLTRDDYYYIVIVIIIIIIILDAFSEIDFVRAASTVIPASKDFWPVGSDTADSTSVLFAPPPSLHAHIHTHCIARIRLRHSVE